MIATVLDTRTGESFIIQGHSAQEWAEGVMAHDAARAEISTHEQTTARHRFIVTGAEFESGEPVFALGQLNALYPPDFLRQHGVEPWEEMPRRLERPSWREADARDLIHPQDAQKLLRLWEVTGINFLAAHILRVFNDVACLHHEPASLLVEEAREHAHYWLKQDLAALRKEWDADEREVGA